MRCRMAGVVTLLLGTAGAAQAQTAGGGSPALQALRRAQTEVLTYVLKSAELMPDAKYAVKPAATVRSFGGLVAHIVDSLVYYCANAAGTNTQWTQTTEDANLARAVLIERLKTASSACEASLTEATLGNRDRARAAVDNIGHTNLHYGNMITYLRLQGLTPPSS